MFRVQQPTGAVRRILTVGATGLIVASFAAACVGGAGSGAGTSGTGGSLPTPVAPASPSAMPPVASTPPVASKPPVVAPKPPAPVPSDEPGRDAMPVTVALKTVDGHDVYVDIVDRTGSMTKAVTGSPAEGMSVDNDTLQIENVDPDTLRLKWIDFGIDNALALFVDQVDGHVRMVLVQPPPKAPADAMGFDRELILSFDSAIRAKDIEAILQDGLDVPG